MSRRRRSSSRNECAKSIMLTSSGCNPRRSPGSQGSTPSKALAIGGGGRQPPRGTGSGGELPPQRPGGGSQGPATIEMLLAFLLLGLRDTLAVSKLSLTLTSNEVNIQVPSLLALLALAAILLALSVRDRWRH